MVDNLRAHTGQEPVCLMTGGAGWKMAPHMTVPFELVEGLIFDGLLAIARERYGNAQAPVPPAPARRP
jgi:type III pantothenate kinase